jgi:hypothetical protein
VTNLLQHQMIDNDIGYGHVLHHATFNHGSLPGPPRTLAGAEGTVGKEMRLASCPSPQTPRGLGTRLEGAKSIARRAPEWAHVTKIDAGIALAAPGFRHFP